MSLLTEFRERYKTAPTEQAKKILFGIIADLTGRKGLDHQWDNIDDDTKEELLETNLGIIRQNLS